MKKKVELDFENEQNNYTAISSINNPINTSPSASTSSYSSATSGNFVFFFVLLDFLFNYNFRFKRFTCIITFNDTFQKKS